MLMPGGPYQRRCLLCRQQQSSESDKSLTSIYGFLESNGRPGYHSSCFEMLRSSYSAAHEIPTHDDLHQLSIAIKPLYHPSDQERRDRASILEGLLSSPAVANILVDSFRQELLRNLPGEILEMILDKIGSCSYLVVLGETRRLIGEMLRRHGPLRECVDLSKDIFVTRSLYQGTSYISRASNTPCKEEWGIDGEEEVISPPPDVEKLLVSTDHIGVHNIQLLERSKLPQGSSPWYQSVDICDEVLKNGLLFRHGFTFLRVVKVDSDSADQSTTDSSHENVMQWTTPFPPDIKPWNMKSTEGGSEISRLHYEPIASDVQGLAVCCSYVMTIGFHCFTSGVSKEYNDFARKMAAKPDVFWMYFPLHAGEYIRYFWLRQLRRGFHTKPIIVVGLPSLQHSAHVSNLNIIIYHTHQLETTRDRSITFGPYVSGNLRKLFLHHSLVRDDDGFVSGIIHDGEGSTNSDCITEMGVTTVHPSTAPPKPAPEIPAPNGNRASISNFIKADRRGGPNIYTYTSPHLPPGFKREPAAWWYMTKAPLVNLASVQTCRDTTQRHKPYIGLLLTYADGSRECLGQFRWDVEVSDSIEAPVWLLTDILMFSSVKRFPRFGDIETMNYVSTVGTVHNRVHEGPFSGYKIAPGKGTVIWWFGVLGVRIEILD